MSLPDEIGKIEIPKGRELKLIMAVANLVDSMSSLLGDPKETHKHRWIVLEILEDDYSCREWIDKVLEKDWEGVKDVAVFENGKQISDAFSGYWSAQAEAFRRGLLITTPGRAFFAEGVEIRRISDGTRATHYDEAASIAPTSESSDTGRVDS